MNTKPVESLTITSDKESPCSIAMKPAGELTPAEFQAITDEIKRRFNALPALERSLNAIVSAWQEWQSAEADYDMQPEQLTKEFRDEAKAKFATLIAEAGKARTL